MDGRHSRPGIVPRIFPATGSTTLGRSGTSLVAFRTPSDGLEQLCAIGDIRGDGEVNDRDPGILADRELAVPPRAKYYREYCEFVFCDGICLMCHRTHTIADLTSAGREICACPDRLTGRVHDTVNKGLIDYFCIHSGRTKGS